MRNSWARGADIGKAFNGWAATPNGETARDIGEERGEVTHREHRRRLTRLTPERAMFGADRFRIGAQDERFGCIRDRIDIDKERCRKGLSHRRRVGQRQIASGDAHSRTFRLAVQASDNGHSLSTTFPVSQSPTGHFGKEQSGTDFGKAGAPDGRWRGRRGAIPLIGSQSRKAFVPLRRWKGSSMVNFDYGPINLGIVDACSGKGFDSCQLAFGARVTIQRPNGNT
jgi:hypothetical protein